MSKNPFINALFAAAYIALIASAIAYAPNFEVRMYGAIAPITFLSLFVLSAALMGYFFVYQPVRLLIEGKQREATKFFLTTVLAFACITGATVLAWFLFSL